MVRGFILLQLVPGLEKDALNQIRMTEGIEDVTLVFGRWDAILAVQAKNINRLTNTIMKQLRGIQGVAQTETLVATDY
ncbi:MAG: Lrp/AsnC family transcriptional regulator [Deltaproteobacteria bacterium]|nr:Lrp/AsnC family transcriptional regulator [Deltaproteobacteria bacterium]